MIQSSNPKSYAYVQIHIAVILFGFTAILGDLISLAATPLVWWRMLLTVISMLFLVRLPSLVRDVGWKHIAYFSGIGVLVAVHWVTFYASIKLANASVALVCLATCSFFTACLEPLFLRQKFKWLDVSIGLIIIPAMIFIVSGLDPSSYLGVLSGLVSSILAATFSVLNKKLIHVTTPLRLTFIELTAGWLFLCAVGLIMLDEEVRCMPTQMDWFYLIILALLCTTLAQYLAVSALRYISAFNSVLIVNLEPVYGILLAAVLLKEYDELTTSFYIGASIIVCSVFIYPLLKRKLK